ncbi:pleiotropic drug resistance subfamily protein [Medicago truncatula]|uniref:Pleiotropic drug resistance subfamily protein n=1 Tax=Medicago truncatula TaxID=3880 RepID=G7L897_MEDTR|nr:pleiotropic drug resistance subfamily protein [Medicago truncatula]
MHHKILNRYQDSGRVTYNGHELSEFVPQRTYSDFSGCCLGVGTRYDMLTELSRREKEAGIKPDPEIDAFMKVTSIEGQETSLVTYYILKVWLCEMLVGPAKALFMDGISTGLDSSTTFQIVRFMR